MVRSTVSDVERFLREGDVADGRRTLGAASLKMRRTDPLKLSCPIKQIVAGARAPERPESMS
jgi:hypothetical protein